MWSWFLLRNLWVSYLICETWKVSQNVWCVWSFLICSLFYISNLFTSNTRLKLAKHQAHGKQHPKAQLLLFKNFSHSSFTLPSKITRHILRNKQNNKCICIHEIIRLIIMNMNMKMKNRSRRYDVNRPRSRQGHIYRKYQCLSVIYICNT